MSIEIYKQNIATKEKELEQYRAEFEKKKQAVEAKGNEELAAVDQSEGANLKKAQDNFGEKKGKVDAAQEVLNKAQVEFKQAQSELKAAETGFKKSRENCLKNTQNQQKTLDNELSNLVKAKQAEIKNLQKQIQLEEKAAKK